MKFLQNTYGFDLGLPGKNDVHGKTFHWVKAVQIPLMYPLQ
jgi:hypothetical protein